MIRRKKTVGMTVFFYVVIFFFNLSGNGQSWFVGP